MSWIDIAAIVTIILFAIPTPLLTYWLGVREGMARGSGRESCCRGGLWDVPDYPPDSAFELEHNH